MNAFHSYAILTTKMRVAVVSPPRYLFDMEDLREREWKLEGTLKTASEVPI